MEAVACPSNPAQAQTASAEAASSLVADPTGSVNGMKPDTGYQDLPSRTLHRSVLWAIFIITSAGPRPHGSLQTSSCISSS